uniref:AlNc14C369G11088 protein n=1 Tax=Albugo laibachii Nc14 TaxID=890382 RepID=F0WY41_9STRA|nr:AlNc14C369G11088 [Albugo laibachii Nc14]|eukprot:CCA26391.1 AlNc14C369G11088 [Albugo laibachii Nc14]
MRSLSTSTAVSRSFFFSVQYFEDMVAARSNALLSLAVYCSILDLLHGKDRKFLERKWLHCNEASYGDSRTHRNMPFMSSSKSRR